MFLKIAFLLFASSCIADCKHLENWTKLKMKFEPSPALLDGPMRLRVFSNCQMAMPVQIGTPPQNLNLSMLFFPTLDAILYLEEVDYVPSSKADPQTYHRNILNPMASSTFTNLSGEFSRHFLGSGYFASDNMNMQSIGNRQSPQMEFILLTETAFLTEKLIENSPADGFLGMAPTEKTIYGMNSFIKWIMQKMGTNSTKMTLYLEKFNPYGPDEMAQNSFALVDLTGKSLLPEFCNEKWLYTEKSSMRMPFWFFMAKNVYLESKNAGNGLSDSKVIDQNVYMFFTNIFFFNAIPEKNMDMLAKMLNATPNHAGIYHLPCNATMNAPTMKFEIVNEQQEKIIVDFEPNDYILPSKSGECFLIFTHLSKNLLTGLPADLNNKLNDDDVYYLLGYSFFKNHCLQLIYDNKNFQQFGFAPKNSGF